MPSHWCYGHDHLAHQRKPFAALTRIGAAGYNKGSNVQFFLVKLLEKHGLKFSDVQSVFLPLADARAAFERGSVDGWLIWDPVLAAADVTLGTLNAQPLPVDFLVHPHAR